jgi:hypothetical protein
MGYAEIEAVLAHSRSRGAARNVMFVIAYRINSTYGYAWLAIDRLAREANVSRRSVINAFPDLEAGGELRIERRAGPSHTHRYFITLPCASNALNGHQLPPIAHDRVQQLPSIAPAPAQDRVQPEPSGGGPAPFEVQSVPSEVQSVHARVQSAPSGGAAVAPKPKQEGNRTSGEENVTPAPAHTHAREGEPETLATGAADDPRPLWTPDDVEALAKRFRILPAHVLMAAHHFRVRYKNSIERHTPGEWQRLFATSLKSRAGGGE